MSTPLFPNLPGLTFARPKYAQAGKRIIEESESGHVLQIVIQVRPRWKYELTYDVLRGFGPMLGRYANFDQVPNFDRIINYDTMTDNEFAVLQGFIIAVNTSAGEFLYDDPKDNTVGLYQFATADGIVRQWQTRFDSIYQGQFPQAPLLFIDQSPDGPLALNAFAAFSGAIDATGLVASSGPLDRGQPLYITTPAATQPGTFLPGEQFGTGDATTEAFQLTRVIGGRALGYAEPIQNLNGSPTIWVDGIKKTVTTDYTLSATGLVTFTSAPANGAVLSWAGKFYMRLRFVKDDIQFSEMLDRLYEAKQLEAISVLL